MRRRLDSTPRVAGGIDEPGLRPLAKGEVLFSVWSREAGVHMPLALMLGMPRRMHQVLSNFYPPQPRPQELN